ncbi:hypothetical protein NA57DRAFT_73743 [Rhizodiscina lignyota]|uniref:Uncharacterized protein n=1 Tax=Rhizodiscina lignyota TaxID=1504668 RepID=A0A9P4M928_9PEZI|nr:hypothetical protein NA57DRAFT_73743 [Rhizodiscina lignyota]
MFGILGGGSNIFAGRRDPTQERQPPPLPTSIRFPSLSALTLDESSKTANGSSISNLQKRISEVRRPSDLKVDLLQSLNLKTTSDVAINDIIPCEYLPPVSWTNRERHTETELDNYPPADAKQLHNGREAPGFRDFSIRLREALVPNETGYDMLAGRTRPDANTPRLAQLRRFWEGLDGMASYWDTSQDEYILPKDKDPSDEQAAEENSSNAGGLDVKAQSPSTDEPRKRAKTDGLHSTAPPRVPSSRHHPSAKPSPVYPPGTYRGHRMSTGSEMPDTHRLDTVRCLIESCIWPFGLSIQPPRRPPLLLTGNLLTPVKLAYSVWRIPPERERAQQRWLEGPIFGVSCRSETRFETDSLESVVDGVSEVAAMLLLAQERARCGRVEKKPGEGQWWTERARWGGGLGGEIGDAVVDKVEVLGVGKGAESGGVGGLNDVVGRPKHPDGKPTVKRAVEAWKVLKPGVGYWDPKVVYEPIGRMKGSEYDEVFLVSALNHHISISKLRVHQQYLDAITAGEWPDSELTESEENMLHISRSRWFDLFLSEDRAEAISALWGLSTWLCRMEEDEEMQQS